MPPTLSKGAIDMATQHAGDLLRAAVEVDDAELATCRDFLIIRMARWSSLRMPVVQALILPGFFFDASMRSASVL